MDFYCDYCERKKPTINEATHYLPKERGGADLLDAK